MVSGMITQNHTTISNLTIDYGKKLVLYSNKTLKTSNGSDLANEARFSAPAPCATHPNNDSLMGCHLPLAV